MTRTKFQTTAQVMQFLRSNNQDFHGIHGYIYILSDGRRVRFEPRGGRNTWGYTSEATEMVEVA